MTRAAISISANGDTTVVTPTAGRIWKIHALVLAAAGTTTVTVKSNSTGVTGAMNLIAGVPLVMPYSEHPHLRALADADPLVLTNSANIAVGGYIEYEQSDTPH